MRLKGGSSMTVIDLTRDQCVALADYLKRCVPGGLPSRSYDEIELLVLARRALRNASTATVDTGLKGALGLEGCSEPNLSTPDDLLAEAQFKHSISQRLRDLRDVFGEERLFRIGKMCTDVYPDDLMRMIDLDCPTMAQWRQVAAALDKLEGGNEDGRQSE